MGDWITEAPNINMRVEIDKKIGDICFVRLDLYFKKKKYYLRYNVLYSHFSFLKIFDSFAFYEHITKVYTENLTQKNYRIIHKFSK